MSSPIQPSYAHSQSGSLRQFINGEWQFAEPQYNQSHGELRIADPLPLPSSFGDWGIAVYSSFNQNRWDIHLIRATGSGTLTRYLTDDAPKDTQPRLSPDTTQVAFVSDRAGKLNIFSISTEATGLIQLTANTGDNVQPAWSPDGRQLMFASNRDGNWNIYRMNANGSGVTRLTSNTTPDVQPSWSPDGQSIVWVKVGVNTGEIWTMQADGSEQRQLSDAIPYLQHPVIAPDSSRIAFDYEGNDDGLGDLATLAPDGSDFQPIAAQIGIQGTGLRSHYTLAGWSPGGDWLVASVAYVSIVNNQLLVDRAFTGGVALSGGPPAVLTFPALDLQPDLRSLDRNPPRTQLSLLPSTTRGTAVALSMRGRDVGATGTVVDDDFQFDNLVYDLQYKVEPDGRWANLVTHGTGNEATYTGIIGTTVAFRLRGIDAAGNREPWRSETGDTRTTFYGYRLVGQFSDNHGRPVPGASIGLTPTAIGTYATDVNGRFAALIGQGGLYAASASAPGYGTPPNTPLTFAGDRSFSGYLPPQDTVISNGTFEADANASGGWTSTGVVTLSSTPAARTGTKAVQLGQPCVSPCLNEGESIPTNSPTNPPPYTSAIAAGDDGTVHVVWQDLNSGSGFFLGGPEIGYQQRTPKGIWSPPLKIGNGANVQATLDGLGILHVVWLNNDGQLVYRQHMASGNWSEPQVLGLATYLQIAADRRGNLYLFSFCYSQLGCANTGEGEYRIRTADGIWQPARTTPGKVVSVALGNDGNVQILWRTLPLGVYAATVRSDGTMSSAAWFGLNEYQADDAQIAIDGANLRHILWSIGGMLYVVDEQADGSFGLPAVLPQGGTIQVAEAAGTLYVATTSSGVENSGTYIRTRSPTGEWSAPTQLSLDTTRNVFLAGDTQGRIHLVRRSSTTTTSGWSRLYYQTSQQATESSESSLTQRITIPATLHKPTLAFDYVSSGGASASQPLLQVLINVEGNEQQVFTSSRAGGWAHAAIDMAAWAGQTLDVTIRLNQVVGVPPATTIIDDVSLGSWLTPVVQTVAEASVEAFEDTPITINGENFIGTPVVMLGTTMLKNVEVADERTLMATVPAGMVPGRYRLVVENPGRQRGSGPMIAIGHQLYLPLVTR